MILEHDIQTEQQTPANAWNLQVGRDICGNQGTSLDHEWLVTNGLGGYAASSIAGATTRSYHGLLVASLHPPVERIVMVTKIDEEVVFPDGNYIKLGMNEYQGGAIDPQGYKYLDAVILEGDIVCFIYRLNESLTLEKRIWMEYGQNTTYVQYMLRGILNTEQQDAVITLNLFPFCLSRDYHATTQGSLDWHFLVDNQGNRCTVRASENTPAYQLVTSPLASFNPTNNWYWHVFHRRDSERGLPAQEDVFQPCLFRIPLSPGMRTTLVLSAEDKLLAEELGGPLHEEYVAQAMMRHQRRVRQLLSVANNSRDDLQIRNPVLARLVVAADQFIVARPDYANGRASSTPHQAAKKSQNLPRRAKGDSVLGDIRLSPDRKTIIAGYPWFTDWGRDSMIALTGLLLCTGRNSEARGLLKAFASFTHNGLIPNRFPDNSEVPEYNTADATLWMFHAIDRYLTMTGDWSLLKDLFSTLTDIVAWHVRGTDYGIAVDPLDGLLRAGEPGVQLTWMDAKVGDWVVTPRRGKPVEINALWYKALTLMEAWAVRLSTDATAYSQLRMKVAQNFAARFWYEEGLYLYDVVDVDGISGQNDASLRPNQLFAASLTHELLSDEQTIHMFQTVTKHLLTPLGLRSLSPSDPAYRSHFNGVPTERDAAYHQGTVWTWLIGPYIDVYLHLNNDRTTLQPLLQPFVQHLWNACLGTISEVAEPESPFTAGGCLAQAWSVAEVLRCWLLTTE